MKKFLVSSKNTNPSLLSCTTDAGYYHDVTNPEQYISTGPKDTGNTNLNLLSYTGGITYYQIVTNSELFVSTGYEDTGNTNLNLLSYTGGIACYQTVTNFVNLGHSLITPDGGTSQIKPLPHSFFSPFSYSRIRPVELPGLVCGSLLLLHTLSPREVTL